MRIIVPLAGPDYFSDNIPKGLKPSINKSPQLYDILISRIWSSDKDIEYTFIFYDCKKSRNFASEYLSKWFPNSNYIYLSKFTQGAALTALASLAFHNLDKDCPLIFDLADIYFKTNIYPDFFDEFSDSSFIGYSFKSNLPIYSYFDCNESFKIKSVAEKKVISCNASAGVYIYKNSSLFLKALSEVFSNPKNFITNDLLYLSNVLNAIIKSGHIASLINVEDYIDYKFVN